MLDLAWGIDLTNVDALEELEFSLDHIHHTTHVLQTITSSRLAVIILNCNGNHHNYPNAWKRLDAALYALVDRVQSTQGLEDEGLGVRVQLFLKSKTQDYDYVDASRQLLPKCIGRGWVMVFGAIVEDPRGGRS